MENVVKNLELIKKEIAVKSNIKIVAVTKTFPISHILPIINIGHEDFGENKVQEAVEKWTNIKQDFPNIKLHLIGKLQTNKVKFALPLFDYIHSLDSIKLANKIANEQHKKNFKPKLYIQVNIGNEPQKSGISPSEIKNFYEKCTKEYNLNVVGLMCIPPYGQDPKPFFREMQILSDNLKLKDLSMGMSDDYLEALNLGSTTIRIGSKIFGKRD